MRHAPTPVPRSRAPPRRALLLAGGATAMAVAGLASGVGRGHRPHDQSRATHTAHMLRGGGGGTAPESRSDGDVGPAVQAAAGAFAGGLARCVVAPLDVIKIRLQVQLEPTRVGGSSSTSGLAAGKYTGAGQALATIVREEGLRGLWRGTVPALLLWVPYTGIQFATLGQLNQLAARLGFHPEQPPASFLCGAGAAAVATTATYPLDLVRTLMAAQGVPAMYPTMASAIRGTLAARGPAGLVSGLGVTLMEIIPYAGLQFGSYAALKQAALRARRTQGAASGAAGAGDDDGDLSSWEKFVCGVLAGSASKLVLHPADVVKKRLQVMGLRRHASYGASVAVGSYTGALQCLGAIARTEGLQGLYKGVVPNILKAAPASGITFVVYEALVAAYQASQHASQR